MKVKDILFPVPKLLKQKTGVAQNKEATVDLGVLGIKIGTEKNTGETSAVKLKEGLWVVKNKDGKEKRFKDANSAEARAWKQSESPKKAPKAAKYSQEWWDDQDVDVYPDTKITHDDDGQVERLVKTEMHKMAPDDWTFAGHYTKKVDGVVVAGRIVRAGWMFARGDDLGLDHDTEHYENFGIVRDVKNPKKFIFDGYKD